MSHSVNDYLPTASWKNLRRRAELLRRIRAFFDARGFLEVETPLLSHDTVVDRHLDPVPVCLFEDPRDPSCGTSMWLQTSPELGMKRLLAAGAESIYQITRAFRGGEQGPLHNPEFTLVEWYGVGDSLLTGMELLDELAQVTLGRGAAERVSYADAFQRVLGLDPHRCSLDELATTSCRYGFQPPGSWDASDRDAWLDWLLVTQIERALGVQRPTIIFDYPASQAALACVREDDPPVAERFELYVDGIELANGYHELLDPQEFAKRAERANVARAESGKYTLPTDSRLFAAMDHGLPPCAGVALGFDRLVMVASGAKSLHEVIPFPIPRA